MVKGVSKQVVVVKPPQGGMFEEAIFILKEDACGVDAGQVLREACAVANDYVTQNCTAKSRYIPAILFAAAGALITGGARLLTAIIK